MMNYLKLPHMDSEVSVFDICQAHMQLEADYNINGFLNDDWHYAGIVCTVLDSDGDETDETDSCWGFETLNNYHETEGKSMAESLAESVHKSKLNNWRHALREARQRKYWASRDVVTTGAHA